ARAHRGTGLLPICFALSRESGIARTRAQGQGAEGEPAGGAATGARRETIVQMSEKTIIAWTDHTANFWLGCTRLSEGCRHCYAATLTKNRMGLDVWGPHAPRIAVKGIYTNLSKWDRDSD